MGKPHVYIRKVKKGYGRERNLEGNLENNSRVLLIDDVFTSGSSLTDSFNIIHDSGGKVSSSVVLIDRLETSHSVFNPLNMKLSSVTNIVDITDILYSQSINFSVKKVFLYLRNLIWDLCLKKYTMIRSMTNIYSCFQLVQL